MLAASDAGTERSPVHHFVLVTDGLDLVDDDHLEAQGLAAYNQHPHADTITFAVAAAASDG